MNILLIVKAVVLFVALYASACLIVSSFINGCFLIGSQAKKFEYSFWLVTLIACLSWAIFWLLFQL